MSAVFVLYLSHFLTVSFHSFVIVLASSSSTILRLHNISPLTKEWGNKWKSSFSAISIISNRISPPHFDFNGNYAWFDQVVSVGSYEQAEITFPELGATFSYPPGTVIQFCGNLLKHSVGDWDKGDRICYAFFVKKVLFDKMNISFPNWARV